MKKTAERETDAKLYSQWLVCIPYYSEESFKSFKEFKEEAYQKFYANKYSYPEMTKQQVYDETEILFSHVGKLVKKNGV